MRIRFDEQLEKLNIMLIEMGALCEDVISYAVKALDEDSEEMRKMTFETDSVIDDMEREIEGLCMKLLLQQQPVARDLRLISAALKMISDMERIGDQAYDIAEITAVMDKDCRNICRDHINMMAEISIDMVTQSIDSFVKKDMDVANDVIIKDDKVDDLFEQVKKDLIAVIVDNKEMGGFFVDMLMIAKYLERISDHAVNIAEWVIFSITGQHVNEKHIEQ